MITAAVERTARLCPLLFGSLPAPRRWGIAIRLMQQVLAQNVPNGASDIYSEVRSSKVRESA